MVMEMSEIKGEFTKKIFLGGTGTMYSTIIDGTEYLFKPAIDKCGFNIEPFRADIQETGYKIQSIVDIQSSIYCFTGDLRLAKGETPIYGAFQKRINTVPTNYRRWQRNNDEILDKDILNGLLRESVTDYLLCNFDSHGGNFILGNDNILRGVDKEQSLRYIRGKDYKVDIDYSPNTIRYGEAEPILHTILKRYMNNELDIDLITIYKYISKVEQIDDKEYLSLFEPYLHSLKSSLNMFDETYNYLVSLILERKQKIKEAFSQVFLDVISARINNSLSSSDDINELENLKTKIKTYYM